MTSVNQTPGHKCTIADALDSGSVYAAHTTITAMDKDGRDQALRRCERSGISKCIEGFDCDPDSCPVSLYRSRKFLEMLWRS